MSGTRDDLIDVTRLAFEAEKNRLRAFLEKEAALRRDIARLDAHKRDMAMLSPDDLHGARAIGAEIAWSAWHDAKRMDLMRRLARHLAGKEAVMTRLSRAHGKQCAAEDIAATARKGRRRRLARTDEDARLTQLLLSIADPRF